MAIGSSYVPRFHDRHHPVTDEATGPLEAMGPRDALDEQRLCNGSLRQENVLHECA